MHQRSNKKIIYPNLWSCFVRGHVQAYEDSIKACLREVKEEIGLEIDPTKLKFLYTRKENNDNGNTNYINNLFFDNYILWQNVDLSLLKLEEDEISQVKYRYYKDIEQLIKNNDQTLIPNFDDYKEIIKYLDEVK